MAIEEHERRMHGEHVSMRKRLLGSDAVTSKKHPLQ